MDNFNCASPKQLQKLIYDTWKLPIVKETETKQPSTDAGTISQLKSVVEDSCPIHIYPKRKLITDFFSSIITSKRNAKAAEALTNFKLWSVSHGPSLGFRVHTNYNITGTRFTRQSSNSPNLQNVGTGKEVETDDDEQQIDFVTRSVFLPRKGHEWLSLDFQSIEFLIWGYCSKNKQVIDCYERGEPLFKPIMEAVWGFFDKTDKKYKRSKNGIYSRIYGSSAAHSDKTFGREGATALIEDRMPEIRPFTKSLHKQVIQNGYIETLGGYHLYVEASEPHKATSAFVQGHAGFVIGEAMVACHEYLKQQEDDIHILLQIHDELIFDGPIGFHERHADNLIRCMREAGEKYGIPTPVNKSLITTDWSNPVEIGT